MCIIRRPYCFSYALLAMETAKSSEPIPKQSNVYEEIVRKGRDVVKKESEK